MGKDAWFYGYGAGIIATALADTVYSVSDNWAAITMGLLFVVLNFHLNRVSIKD